MNNPLDGRMADALRLVRSGRLTEVTQRLQKLLGGGMALKGTFAPTPGMKGGGAASWAHAGPTLDATAARVGEASASLPPGSRFLSRSFAGEAGSRGYKLFVPSGYNGQPVPLIVMLHGCTQSPDDFAAGTRMNEAAEQATCLVAYPEQSTSANMSRCWNWFNAADQQRGKGEPSLIVGIAGDAMQDHAVDRRRIYVAGLSAGGAVAATLGALYPDFFAAVGVHSGLACGAASDMQSAFAAMRHGNPGRLRPGKPDAIRRAVPVIVFHGDRDTTVNPANAEAVIDQSSAAAAAVQGFTGSLTVATTEGRVPGGHGFSRSCYLDAAGEILLENWTVHGSGHAWSGGSTAGSFTDPHGPDATAEMIRFFLDHPLT